MPWNDEPSTVTTCNKLTGFGWSVWRRSSLHTLQPRQGHWLSLRGDAVWGLDWKESERPEERGPIVRTFDPAWCYPLFSPDDLGAVQDMLIAFEVQPQWVTANFPEVRDLDREKNAQIFYYWDAKEMHVQIGEQYLETRRREHKLGFCPFRWVFGDPSGLMAQSDIREVPKLQDVFNENLLLALDAIRKQVDPSWYATGIKRDIEPEPGMATALPEGSNVGAWPVTASPEIILGVMHALESFIQSMTGVSPISMSGQAQGSIVTGAAVRHQVEAIEQRAEMRKYMLQATYARLLEYVLRLTEAQFPEQEIVFRAASAGGRQSLTGNEIQQWYECEAEYGGFLGLSPEQRVQVAMSILGRLGDEELALKIADFPGVNPGDMQKRLEDYHLRQAGLAARGQALGQQVLQQMQGQEAPPGMTGAGPALPPGGMPQGPHVLPQPTPVQMGVEFVSLGQVEAGMRLIESTLKGAVWAVGELAVAGQSSRPIVMVQAKEDLARVKSVVGGLRGDAYVGSPDGEPKIQLV